MPSLPLAVKVQSRRFDGHPANFKGWRIE